MDARGIAQLLRMGWYRPVHRKSPAAQEVRALLVGRKLLQAKLRDIELSIRGILGADPDVHGRVRVAHAVEVGSDPDAVGRALAVRLRADVDATAGKAHR